jgi:hypothetical protein
MPGYRWQKAMPNFLFSASFLEMKPKTESWKGSRLAGEFTGPECLLVHLKFRVALRKTPNSGRKTPESEAISRFWPRF